MMAFRKRLDQSSLQRFEHLRLGFKQHGARVAVVKEAKLFEGDGERREFCQTLMYALGGVLKVLSRVLPEGLEEIDVGRPADELRVIETPDFLNGAIPEGTRRHETERTLVDQPGRSHADRRRFDSEQSSRANMDARNDMVDSTSEK